MFLKMYQYQQEKTRSFTIHKQATQSLAAERLRIQTTDICGITQMMERCMSPAETPNLLFWSEKNRKTNQHNIEKGMYEYLVNEIREAASQTGINQQHGGGCSDGRLDSAMKELPFLSEMRSKLLLKNPTWDIQISPPRASCDVIINGLQINLKLTDCKTADNSSNKRAIYYSITGQTDYPYSSNWNEFWARLKTAKTANQFKTVRDPMTEYHYLVKNKITGDVLFKSIFDIHTYLSNPSNDLQINWRNEFVNKQYSTPDERYTEKVGELLVCLQRSVSEMIRRNEEFAVAEIAELLKR